MRIEGISVQNYLLKTEATKSASIKYAITPIALKLIIYPGDSINCLTKASFLVGPFAIIAKARF